jgi:hypothetical protein
MSTSEKSESMKRAQICEHTTIDEAMNEIRETSQKTTDVVAWYAHSSEVRGPFCRWLEITDVLPEYQKHVAFKHDEAKYIAACLNYAPMLIEEIERLRQALVDESVNRKREG